MSVASRSLKKKKKKILLYFGRPRKRSKADEHDKASNRGTGTSLQGTVARLQAGDARARHNHPEQGPEECPGLVCGGQMVKHGGEIARNQHLCRGTPAKGRDEDEEMAKGGKMPPFVAQGGDGVWAWLGGNKQRVNKQKAKSKSV
jgi:hypothetical protein